MWLRIPLGSVLLQKVPKDVQRMRRDIKESGPGEAGPETRREERREPPVREDSSGAAGVQT